MGTPAVSMATPSMGGSGNFSGLSPFPGGEFWIKDIDGEFNCTMEMVPLFDYNHIVYTLICVCDQKFIPAS